MKVLSFILLTSLFINFGFGPVETSSQESMDQFKERFLKTSGLQLGIYKLLKGPINCLGGELQILTHEEFLNLMLGQHSLINRITPIPIKTADDLGCTYVHQVTIKANLIVDNEERLCKSGKKFISHGELTIKGSRLTFKKRNANGVNYTCDLKKVD